MSWRHKIYITYFLSTSPHPHFLCIFKILLRISLIFCVIHQPAISIPLLKNYILSKFWYFLLISFDIMTFLWYSPTKGYLNMPFPTYIILSTAEYMQYSALPIILFIIAEYVQYSSFYMLTILTKCLIRSGICWILRILITFLNQFWPISNRNRNPKNLISSAFFLI